MIIQHGAVAALTDPKDCVVAILQVYQHGLDLRADLLKELGH
jgi:hypothetical protein